MHIPNQHQIRRLGYFASLFEDTSSSIFEKVKYPSVVYIQPKGRNKIKAAFPLIDHVIYGETILSISEKLDESGSIIQYHYGWEESQRIRTKGKQVRHIMAFGNENHRPGSHGWVETNPFHHHHVPGEPKQRKSTTVQTLEEVIQILQTYICVGKHYDSSHNF